MSLVIMSIGFDEAPCCECMSVFCSLRYGSRLSQPFCYCAIIRPASWVDCSAHIQAFELPPGTRINTNGAGDSFTSGLLVAAMLRHTGMSVPVRNVDDKAGETMMPEASFDTPSYPPDPPARHSATGNKKTLTPYTLYMRENYVSLKRQCKDDKKVRLFSLLLCQNTRMQSLLTQFCASLTGNIYQVP